MPSTNPFINPFNPKTERVPLVGNFTNRLASSSKDQVFYNTIPEVLKNEITETKKVWLNKRGGFTAQFEVVPAGGEGRAIFYWSSTDKVYSIIGNKLYANATEIQTLATSTGTCWITEFLSSSATKSLIVGDGIDLYSVSTSDVVTPISDGDLPSTQITPQFFDSYIFIAKADSPSIYNSDVDDPLSWDPTNFISAEQYPDNLVALARQVNYLVAFGSYSTEFFFDAANASGSPLARQESVSLKVGIAARDTIAQTGRHLYWIAQTQTGEPCVYTFEGLTGAEVSNEFIRKILQNEGASLASAKAWICTHKGHTLYVINLSTRTIVYDCLEKVWTEWSSNNGGSHTVLPFNYATEGSNNQIFLVHNSDGRIYRLDPTRHTDDAGAILATVITDRVDFNTNNLKALFSLSLICDKQTTGTVTVDWSDDDYLTWSNPRTLDLTAGRAYTKSAGVFRRRAFRFKHTADAPFRAEVVELEIQHRTS